MCGLSHAEPLGLPPVGPPWDMKFCPGMADSHTTYPQPMLRACQQVSRGPGAEVTQAGGRSRTLACGAACGIPRKEPLAVSWSGQPKGGLCRMGRFPEEHWERVHAGRGHFMHNRAAWTGKERSGGWAASGEGQLERRPPLVHGKVHSDVICAM